MYLAQSIRNPTIGDVFGIRSSTDGSFYRGTVKEKLNENQFSVVLLDLGTEDVVSINSFVEIPKQLKEASCIFYLWQITMIKHVNY